MFIKCKTYITQKSKLPCKNTIIPLTTMIGPRPCWKNKVRIITVKAFNFT